MTDDIDPTTLDRFTTLEVTDRDSPYWGTQGEAWVIYDDRIELSLDVSYYSGELIKSFDIDQLSRVDG